MHFIFACWLRGLGLLYLNPSRAVALQQALDHGRLVHGALSCITARTPMREGHVRAGGLHGLAPETFAKVPADGVVEDSPG